MIEKRQNLIKNEDNYIYYLTKVLLYYKCTFQAYKYEWNDFLLINMFRNFNPKMFIYRLCVCYVGIYIKKKKVHDILYNPIILAYQWIKNIFYWLFTCRQVIKNILCASFVCIEIFICSKNF